MLALAFIAAAGGVVLLVAGVTGSSVASAAKGKPDHANVTSSAGTAPPAAGSVTAAPSSGRLGSLLGAARSQLGVPYKWGGELAGIEFD
ncbi:MAG TPA: hypothetical protein VMP89_06000, partial [Solirubrobacteraceae bacterium]|nr:hypothetical protein [Solirubrobacteraceae bacterium]